MSTYDQGLAAYQAQMVGVDPAVQHSRPEKAHQDAIERRLYKHLPEALHRVVVVDVNYKNKRVAVTLMGNTATGRKSFTEFVGFHELDYEKLAARILLLA